MDNISDTEWDHFCDSYIGKQTNNKKSHQKRMCTPSYKQGTKLKVSLKYFTTTTRKRLDWPKYRRNFVVTLTANVHQHVIDKKSG